MARSAIGHFLTTSLNMTDPVSCGVVLERVVSTQNKVADLVIGQAFVEAAESQILHAKSSKVNVFYSSIDKFQID